jgi:hypothetical protein
MYLISPRDHNDDNALMSNIVEHLQRTVKCDHKIWTVRSPLRLSLVLDVGFDLGYISGLPDSERALL